MLLGGCGSKSPVCLVRNLAQSEMDIGGLKGQLAHNIEERDAARWVLISRTSTTLRGLHAD